MASGLGYNGWLDFVRHGRDKHYYHARQKGVLPEATNCLGCKAEFTGPVPYHAEEYGPTLEDYWASCAPLCHRCHAMLHARFKTPNRWKRYLSQAVLGQVDASEFPNSTQIAALLSKYKSREDIPDVKMPEGVPDYFKSLSLHEYVGPEKVATLLVIDLSTLGKVEVPDWTLYGQGLERLSEGERESLSKRGIDVDAFLSGRIVLPRDVAGARIYTSRGQD